MQLPLRAIIKTFVASAFGAIRSMVSKFTTAFQEWWIFCKTRTSFVFRKYPRLIFFLSGIIEIFGIILRSLLPAYGRMMDATTLIIFLVLLPLFLLLVIFFCSLRPKWREEFDKCFGFGKISIERRLDRIEALLRGQHNRTREQTAKHTSKSTRDKKK